MLLRLGSNSVAFFILHLKIHIRSRNYDHVFFLGQARVLYESGSLPTAALDLSASCVPVTRISGCPYPKPHRPQPPSALPRCRGMVSVVSYSASFPLQTLVLLPRAPICQVHAIYILRIICHHLHIYVSDYRAAVYK